MKRNAIAAAVACLYIGLSAWLVRTEGQSYRERLIRGQASKSEFVDPDQGPGQAPAEKAKAIPAPSGDPGAHTDASQAPRAADLPPASVSAPPTLKPTLVPASESHSPEAGPREVAMIKPGTARAPEMDLSKLDPFWSQPELKRNWNLANLSDQDEMRLGESLHALILHFNPPATGGPWLERVDQAAKPVLSRVSRKSIRYTFTILDSNDVNAFSHFGGYIYLTRGVFSFLGEDEDAALLFILAHEIAHVDQKHMLECLRDRDLQGGSMGTLEKAYFVILPLGYPNQQEFAADQWAYRQLVTTDHTRYESLKFLRKLKNYASAHDFGDGRVHYRPTRDSSPVQNHLRSHPAAWKRLSELEAFLNAPSGKSR